MRRTLLITGASAGIGAAIARLAATRGYDLALNYRQDRAGAESVAEAARHAGATVILCPGDVADPEDIRRIYARVDEGFDRLDGLVNNAGIVDRAARVTDLTHDRLRRMFDVNVIGAILVAKEAVLRMQAHGRGGAIVNLSSAAARLGSANQYVDYAASKAAIDTFTKGLADEVAAEGIRVNALRPGLIETGIHAKGGEPDRAQRLAPGVPMQRTGTVTEVAEAALFLLSDAASYITGTTLDVSGGR
ncbi:SDR family oxidoreductase [Ruegeria pomeroyi]|uniref:SDR family oxidoreductase n=1 Tax=Ruegeria alba TaxID=2916756 RepID=A0ABS9NUV5_9RHOB|nr:SDR family oxidoreductase [Ruegeria alba]MCE8516462.1 SDR family oxidoreductase [Ruegeria pomeroyi]MCE8521467.1 SDR family oxidoreductase [Ruegeria pomeroyi]MCE8526059.1 SDR family oxidoreductase [Ruegeria pomeroyi]MCE8534050.1 SDR family oxidoreductase [Ruegeria pomeroyi]MCE8554078.1 SDR family oxidoreductase [Ruegeria pomeroyi]